MFCTLKNGTLEIKINSKGAELKSLVKDGIEYLWQGDPVFWKRSAPVLFPIVGKLTDDVYRHEGETYSLTQHGFARDNDFALIQESADRLVFELKESTETLKHFPFNFVLRITYTLTQASIDVKYEVVNTDKKTLYFSIGAHPAFNIPLDRELTFEDYAVEIDPKLKRTVLPLKGPHVDPKASHQVDWSTRPLPLKRSLFDQDALIVENDLETMQTYRLVSTKDTKAVAVSFKGLPYTGIWSLPGKEAPFVCIEPWAGIADTVAFDGTLKEKKGIQSLFPQDTYNMQYTITLT
ncbi:aldose 1-epimerase family protein [Lacticigenium naphthae]|uniref:aldose 1-epimerase family protein n=1 Tax=Lacticigenium naphthae TaxID=515351 RepID=UPI0003F5DE39|nr:aldose 1-epimerase family protein [Lacticigenium naphthae]